MSLLHCSQRDLPDYQVLAAHLDRRELRLVTSLKILSISQVYVTKTVIYPIVCNDSPLNKKVFETIKTYRLSTPQGDQGEPGEAGSDGRPGEKVSCLVIISYIDCSFLLDRFLHYICGI